MGSLEEWTDCIRHSTSECDTPQLITARCIIQVLGAPGEARSALNIDRPSSSVGIAPTLLGVHPLLGLLKL